MTRELLIGTYTNTLPHVDGHADGILSARFDGTSLQDLRVAARTVNPSWVTTSADGSAVYAVGETGPDGSVSAYARDEHGVLTPLGSASSGGAAPAHLSVHPSGRFLLTGTYGGGSVSVFPLRGDGSLRERSAFIQHVGRGPNPARQEAPHVHQVVTDPVTGDVVVVDLGIGEIRWYELSPEGALTLRPEATVSSGASGPRHIVFHPDHRHAFVVNELESTLDVLRRDGDRFTMVGSASTRDAGASGDNLPAALQVAGDGASVIVTNRGDDTIAVFAFDAEVSRVSLATTESSHGRSPRDLVVSPDGDRLLAACQDSDEVTVFAFDPRSRSVRYLGTSLVPTPVCLRFV